MSAMTLSPERDPMGAAIADYLAYGKASKLRVFSSQFDEDEIPVPQLFRSYEQMPEIERVALQRCSGRILDVGAGSGCHSLALQAMEKPVMAIDISPLSVAAMRERGVKDVRCINLFDPALAERFDTILLLMNGSGIVGKLANFPAFFVRMKQLLTPGGQILMDSSDLSYLFEDEEGHLDWAPVDDYYGEVDFRMQYKQVKGDPFDWIYIDFCTLSLQAAQAGFQAEKIAEGEHFDYLARLTLK